jgi:hypothetical protein
METTEKTFLEKLAEYAKAQNAARPRPRKDKNVVEFLAVRSDIQKAIEDGYSVKIIWELLQREEKITYQYETFAKLDFGHFCSWATAPHVTPRRCRSVC